MNYIVLDLEWNQCPEGKEHENKALPFEIIEIGAVKLNERLQVLGEFESLVRPQVYTQLHRIVKDLLDVSSEELGNGPVFESAIRSFLEWCGEDYIFCLWGSGDLTELQRNMKFYDVSNPFPMPFIFYDIQKFYSLLYEDGKIRRSLQSVIEAMHMQGTEGFHRAVNDARYTARIIQLIDFEKIRGYYSIDCYRIPAKRSEEIHAVYETYEKYISRGYRTREGAVDNRESQACTCYICHRSCVPVIPWFSANTKVYYGLYTCPEHGFIKVRMRVKLADNGKYYAMKITKITDEAGAQKVRSRQEALRKKRQERRHHVESSCE